MSFREFQIILLSAVLLGVGFIFPFLWWCGFFGVTLALVAIPGSENIRSSILKGFLLVFLWKAIVHAPVFFSLFPFDWFGIESSLLQFSVIIGIWLTSTVLFSFSGIILGALLFLFKGSDLHYLYIVPAAWIVSEWMGFLIFSFTSAGSGSLLGAHFTSGALGYLLTESPLLLQASSVAGLAGLSALTALMGALIFIVWNKRKLIGRKRLLILPLVLILSYTVATLGFNYFKEIKKQENTDLISVAVISRYLEPHSTFKEGEEKEIFLDLVSLVSPLRNIDVLVFPENSTFLRSFSLYSEEVKKGLLEEIGVSGAAPLIIDSEDILSADGTLYSRVTYKSSKETLYGYKQMVMPFGEYLPYVYEYGFKLVGAGNLIDNIARQRNYQKGPDGGDGLSAGALVTARFCDEVFSSELFRDQVRAGSNVLTNISSQSWFHGSPIVYYQMKMAAKVRAVENRRFLVQSGNMTPAFIIDEFGDTVEETNWDNPSVVEAEVKILKGSTLFNILGDTFWYVFALLVLSIYGVISLILGRKKA